MNFTLDVNGVPNPDAEMEGIVKSDNVEEGLSIYLIVLSLWLYLFSASYWR